MATVDEIRDFNSYCVLLMNLHDSVYTKEWLETPAEKRKELEPPPKQPAGIGDCDKCGATANGLPAWSYGTEWALCRECVRKTNGRAKVIARLDKVFGPVDPEKAWPFIRECVSRFAARQEGTKYD